jgi:hypothetical protein
MRDVTPRASAVAMQPGLTACNWVANSRPGQVFARLNSRRLEHRQSDGAPSGWVSRTSSGIRDHPTSARGICKKVRARNRLVAPDLVFYAGPSNGSVLGRKRRGAATLLD